MGAAVRGWCMQHGWLLVWALGKNGDTAAASKSGAPSPLISNRGCSHSYAPLHSFDIESPGKSRTKFVRKYTGWCANDFTTGGQARASSGGTRGWSIQSSRRTAAAGPSRPLVALSLAVIL